jgi:hypothetical protein
VLEYLAPRMKQLLAAFNASRYTLVQQVVRDLDAVIVSRVQAIQHICQLSHHATKPIVLLVLFSILNMIPSENLSMTAKSQCLTMCINQIQPYWLSPAARGDRAPSSMSRNRPS